MVIKASFCRLTILFLVVIAFIFNLSIQKTSALTHEKIPPNNVNGKDRGSIGKDYLTSETKKPRIMEDYGRLPLYFIENQGQLDKKIKFYEKSHGHNTFFTMDGIYISLNKKKNEVSTEPNRVSIETDVRSLDTISTSTIKLIPIGMSKDVEIISRDPHKAKVHYLIGNNPEKWKSNIPTYRSVVYKGAYPGIDLKFYGTNQQMEYDIIVKPGFDPSVVKFKYEGIESLETSDEGNLIIKLKGNEKIIQKKPSIYQEINGERIELAGKFKLMTLKHKVQNSSFAYGFELDSFDPSHSLIIDPVLVYSTYLGGTGSDVVAGIAVDSFGNAYVTGTTTSIDFPTANAYQDIHNGNCPDETYPCQDIFVVKLNATGTNLIYSTYLGGTNEDYGSGIAVDTSGNVYVIGDTYSSDFPTLNPVQSNLGGDADAFITKLNADGTNLIYSTYLGGTNYEQCRKIAVDSSGNAYVTGGTGSSDFPTANPFQEASGGGGDAFVTKLNPQGTQLIYSTYLGGSDSDSALGIDVDSSGNAYVTGDTLSSDFPTANAYQDIHNGNCPGETYTCQDTFVVKLNAAGTNLIYSTFLGGTDWENSSGIAVDSSGNAYVTGSTPSSDFSTENPFQGDYGGGEWDAFVTKLNAAGTNLIYSTFLGGSDSDSALGIVVDTSGNAYVIGLTASSDFPTVNPCQGNSGGNGDVFVTKLNAQGSELVYSTYLGGGGFDQGQGIAVDSSGNAYVTGLTASSNFPYTAVPFQSESAGDLDIFITKLAESDNTPPEVFSTTPANNAVDVPLDTSIGATYSEWVNDSTVTYTVSDGAQDIDGSKWAHVWGPNMEVNAVGFSPSSPLEYNRTYTVTIGAGVEDLHGNATENEYTWSFSTLSWNTLIINASANTGGSISPTDNVAVYEGFDQTFTFTPNDGYYIEDVIVDGESVGPVSEYIFENVTANHTIQATFAIFTYTITSSVVGEGGQVSPAGEVIVNHGSDQTFSITPESGYQISGVHVDGSLVGAQDSYTFSNVTANHTIFATFTVLLQAYTSLSMNLSSQTILQTNSIDISGKLSRLPDVGMNLSNLPIVISITDPDEIISTVNISTYDSLGHYQLEDLSVFAKKGVYTLKASFEGTSLLYASVSDMKSILVGSQAGYAIIVEGKILNGEGIDSHNKTANRIYQRLKERGFSDLTIQYFNYDNSQEGWDAIPSKTGIKSAIETWASAMMNGSPAPLYIIMVDHGDINTFYIGEETITPSELDTWLDTLENNLNENALMEKRIVIIGACYSGSFIPTVSEPGRIIVSSASNSEPSYKGPQESDGVRSGEFFLEEFFQQLWRGETIKYSFEKAVEQTEIFTRRGSDFTNANTPPYFDNAAQHPLLDDNGDGFGSNILSEEEDEDGYASQTQYLGVGLSYDANSANNPAEILDVTETIYLDTSTSSADLWAISNDDNQVASAWVEIRTPSMTLSSTSNTNQLEIDLTNQFLTFNESSSRWEKTYESFTESGMYEIFYYASDVETQDISPTKRSVVYKAKMDNKFPASFGLSLPDNGATVWTDVILDWQDTTDPDADRLTYTVILSKNDDSFSNPIRVEGLEYSTCLVNLPKDPSDTWDYCDVYWKVQAIDIYGAITETAVRMFHTDNTNSVAGWIKGYVYDQDSGQPIDNAVINVGSLSFDSVLGGYYIGAVSPGTYQIEATAEGYHSKSYSDVSFSQGVVLNKSFALSPVSGGMIKGDINGMDGVNLSDAIIALQALSKLEISETLYTQADVDGDGKIGLEEVIYILQDLSDLR